MLCCATLDFRPSVNVGRYSEKQIPCAPATNRLPMVEQVKFSIYKGINVCDEEEIGCHDTVNKIMKKVGVR